MRVDLYCPRCDRRLTPDHKCLSRRVFLDALLAPLIQLSDIEVKMVELTETFIRGRNGYFRQLAHNGNVLTSECCLREFPFVTLNPPLQRTVEYMEYIRLVSRRELSAVLDSCNKDVAHVLSPLR